MLTYKDVRDFYLPQGIRTIACIFAGDGLEAGLQDPLIPIADKPGSSLEQIRDGELIGYGDVAYCGGPLATILPGLKDLLHGLLDDFWEYTWDGNEPGAGVIFWDLETGEVLVDGWYTYTGTDEATGTGQVNYGDEADELYAKMAEALTQSAPPPRADFMSLLRATLEGS